LNTHDAETKTDSGQSLLTDGLAVFPVPAFLRQPEPVRLDYVARFPGMPGYGAWCADDPKYKKDTAKTVADWIKRGATIERVTIEAAKAGMLEYLEAKEMKEKHGEQAALL
jgi:hypothetical protein